jgi:hypothetical protein
MSSSHQPPHLVVTILYSCLACSCKRCRRSWQQLGLLILCQLQVPLHLWAAVQEEFTVLV